MTALEAQTDMISRYTVTISRQKADNETDNSRIVRFNTCNVMIRL